jgi:hypothetical protein
MDDHPTLIRGWTESRLQAGSPSHSLDRMAFIAFYLGFDCPFLPAVVRYRPPKSSISEDFLRTRGLFEDGFGVWERAARQPREPMASIELTATTGNILIP